MSKLRALAFLFTFVAPHAAFAAEPPLKVGVLASLSGNWAAIGRNIEQGAVLAAEELNTSGGVLGREVQLEIQDTDEEKSGAKVVAGYRFLQTRGASFFVGPTGVPGIMALTPLAIKDDIVLIAPTSTNSFYRSSPKFFNASGDNYVTTKATAVRAYKRGARRMAIFGSLQPWENDQAKIFKAEFTSLGGLIVSEEYPAADQTDLRTEALRITQAKPEGVFYAIFNQVSLAAKALARQGFKGAQYAAIMDSEHAAASDGALNGTELFLFNPPASEFVDRFKRRFRDDPGVFADSSYDAVFSLGEALKVAGTVDRKKVIEALHRIKFMSSSGEMVGFDEDGLLARKIALHEIVNGEVKRKID